MDALATKLEDRGDRVRFAIATADPVAGECLPHMGYLPTGPGRYATRWFPADARRLYDRFAACIGPMVRQCAGLEPAPWEDALLEALRRLQRADVDWWLYGSGALAVRGLPIAPADVDLHVEDPFTAGRLFDDILVTPGRKPKCARCLAAPATAPLPSLDASPATMTAPDVTSPPRRTRVLIVSDIALYRDGIARLLEHDAGMEVVASAPDIALVDATMGTSLATVRSVRERWPECRVIVLSLSDVEGDVLRFAEAGVAGYLPSTACKGDLVAAIESVERGEAACPPRAAAALLRRVAGLSREPSSADGCLTARETEILRLIDEGLSNKDIATRLYIGVPTVKTHVHNILRKLGASRRGQAAARLRFGV